MYKKGIVLKKLSEMLINIHTMPNKGIDIKHIYWVVWQYLFLCEIKMFIFDEDIGCA